MTFKLPPLSALLSALGGSAGVVGVICTLIGTTPSTALGKAIEGILSAALVLVSSWHVHSVTAARAKAKTTA